MTMKEKRMITGEIIEKRGRYFIEAIALYVLKRFDVKPPVEVILSDRWSWTRHDCCICGKSFRPYVPTGTLIIPDPHKDFINRYPICDDCIESKCPGLYKKLEVQRAKFDAELKERTKAEDEARKARKGKEKKDDWF